MWFWTVKERQIFDQADKVIGFIKEKNFGALSESIYQTGFKLTINDTFWINTASPLIKKYAILDHSKWTLKKTDMGYEVHVPLLNVQESSIMYRSYDLVLLHTPDDAVNKVYDFRLEGDLSSAKKTLVEAPK